ncbi:MAG: hypothetical protein RMZ41_022965 [Nostoc sp. DedVER02]
MSDLSVGMRFYRTEFRSQNSAWVFCMTDSVVVASLAYGTLRERASE